MRRHHHREAIMKQLSDWREHLGPMGDDRFGMRLETGVAYPLMAAAIIVAVTGLLIFLATCGALPASIATDSMLIGA
jgi:hypothetical protein